MATGGGDLACSCSACGGAGKARWCRNCTGGGAWLSRLSPRAVIAPGATLVACRYLSLMARARSWIQSTRALRSAAKSARSSSGVLRSMATIDSLAVRICCRIHRTVSLRFGCSRSFSIRFGGSVSRRMFSNLSAFRVE